MPGDISVNSPHGAWGDKGQGGLNRHTDEDNRLPRVQNIMGCTAGNSDVYSRLNNDDASVGHGKEKSSCY